MHHSEPLEPLAAPEPQARDDDPAVPVAAWRFRVAVLRHRRIVYGVARSLLRDPADAEDVTQEAFLRYWQQGGDVRRAREWLLRVARNLSLDRLRAAGRFVDGDPDAEIELADERDPAWHHQQGELKATLARMIQELPEPQRSLIVLFDVQGLSGEACARILGISVNQVKVYLHRARRRLRRKLEQWT